MRSLSRLGVAIAATALAGTTALAGAGVAGAQGIPDTGSVVGNNFTMSSNSTLSSTRTVAGIDVTYTNRTNKTLACSGISAPENFIEMMDAHVAKYGERSLGAAAVEA